MSTKRSMMMTTTTILYVMAAVVWGGPLGASSAEQSFVVEPNDRSAVVNDNVSLPCRVADLAGQLQWTKDDFALGTNRNLSYHGYPRYTMTGSDATGKYRKRFTTMYHVCRITRPAHSSSACVRRRQTCDVASYTTKMKIVFNILSR